MAHHTSLGQIPLSVASTIGHGQVVQPIVTHSSDLGTNLSLQPSAYQHAVQRQEVTPTMEVGNSQTLNTEATPFIPETPTVPVLGRSVEDVLRDHSEVERVLQGGMGSSTTDQGIWQRGQTVQVATQTQYLSSQLPFNSCEVPPVLAKQARPTVRTNTLKELHIIYANKVFTDRELPAPAKPIAPHGRFTHTYYVALYNLAASTGRDGNGFWYPAHTPNYLGARIPLVHTGLKINNWRKHLIGYGEGNELLQFMEFGFPLGLVEKPTLKACERNHGSSYQYFPHMDKFIVTEITRGGLTGPFNLPPWEDMMLSPLMTAPKKPDTRRPVFDATFGDSSLNNATPGDCYLGTPAVYTYPEIDDFRKIVLSCGPGAQMWKRDLHRFYLQIPMDPVDYRYVGCVWRGLFFFFVALMFGLRHSGLQGQRITDAVSWVHRRSGLDSPTEKPYNCINYCDDFGGAEASKDRADQSFVKLRSLLDELGLSESVDKSCSPRYQVRLHQDDHVCSS